ncbi:hypothetical protein AAFF_G00255180 [Aldrovandia affinis]|uniref:Uncharacterized protein n=1 Tax=Aldrovandia affinis TaxID=143900 RepID=A0AAD7RD07_9TELE|nr:hypothetical protein AAFF_G00255180 [Aldrovandia affinis]
MVDDSTPVDPQEGCRSAAQRVAVVLQEVHRCAERGRRGVTMLLAGYCVLSYVWSYPHLKHERWRKYH